MPQQEKLLTSEQQIQTASRVIHEAELLQNYDASYTAAAKFYIPQDQADRLHQEHNNSTSLQEAGKSSPETSRMSPERLQEIVNNSIYVASPYIRGQEHLTYNGVYKGKTKLPIFRSMMQYFPSKEIEAPFINEGVSELVTIGESSGIKFKGKSLGEGSWPAEGPYKDEPMYVVQYMTLTGGVGKKYEYYENPSWHLKNMSPEDIANLDDDKRAMREKVINHKGRISEFNYSLLLPQTLAEELGDAMKENPQLARELGDMLVYNPEASQDWISTVKNWEHWKPPYDKWREANGGVDRMAFRTASDQTVDESKIVEY